MQYSDLYNDKKYQGIYFREYKKQIDSLSKKGYKGMVLSQCARALATEVLKKINPKLRRR